MFFLEGGSGFVLALDHWRLQLEQRQGEGEKIIYLLDFFFFYFFASFLDVVMEFACWVEVLRLIPSLGLWVCVIVLIAGL